MTFQLPTDLIRQVQLSLRNDAGLSLYDPDDPTLPSFPSLREVVAGLDPSPAYLRCKHCHSRLLRGLQSAICVYCGERQPKDVPPDPIAFKSTFGYQWLLQSLDLDGSETVGPSIAENELNRRHSTRKDEILISDLLNFEIAAESEKTEHNFTNNASKDGSSLNLAGVDLVSFFAESNRDLVSHSLEVQPATNKHSENVEINAFGSQENLSLFQNVQHSATTMSSSEGKDNDGFSGWEADFQSADSGNHQGASGSFDPFMGSTVDLSVHMDSVFGPGKDIENEKAKDASTPLASAANDWSQDDDLWNNSTFLAPHQAEQIGVTIKSKDVAADGMYTTTSTDLFPDDRWQTNSKVEPENKTINKDDDSFDVWNDFTSSTREQDPSKHYLTQSSSQIAAVDEQRSDVIFSSSSNKLQEMDFGSLSQPDPFSGSCNLNGSVEVNNMQSEVPTSDRPLDSEDMPGPEDVSVDSSPIIGVSFRSSSQSKLTQFNSLSRVSP
ncbi:hypothetical protein U1Q18_001208 [Sarracenia purpurea var. burkii]